MNYQLMAHGYLPVSIPQEQRLEYFTTLEEYALNGTIGSFADMIAELEHEQLDLYIRAIQVPS